MIQLMSSSLDGRRRQNGLWVALGGVQPTRPQGGPAPYGGRELEERSQAWGQEQRLLWSIRKAAVHVVVGCCVGVLQNRINVVHLGQTLEERQQIEQLRVRHVIEPRRYRHLGGEKETTSGIGSIRKAPVWCEEALTALSGWKM